ncbi:MAG: hypothetical protein EOO20_13440, partial [Chryseobacterium sp.]
MKFITSESAEYKLKSISTRIENIAHGRTTYNMHVDQRITTMNLKHNLSLIIAKIILRLQYVDRTKDSFIDVIENYNFENDTNLTFEDFESMGFIRSSMGDVIFPTVVSRYLSLLEKENIVEGDEAIPEHLRMQILCLHSYYKRCFEHSSLTIKERTLKGIISGNSRNKLTVKYFLEKGLLKEKGDGVFSWLGHEITRYLANEIAATLWIILKETDCEYQNKYFKLLLMTGIWPDDGLERFLPVHEKNELRDLAVSYLKTEKDFDKSEIEFRKVWLDSEYFREKKINLPIPNVRFNYDNVYDFIGNNIVLSRLQHVLTDYQSSRRFALFLLRFIIPFDRYPSPFGSLLPLLRDMERPALIWTIYQEISPAFPKLIPYLLKYQDLAALAFNLIDDIKIDTELLGNARNNQDKAKVEWEAKNSLWLEMFDLVLVQYSDSQAIDTAQAEVMFRILNDCASKTFSNYVLGTDWDLIHQFYRSRYDKGLKRLSVQRQISKGGFSHPLHSRTLFYLIPKMADLCIAELDDKVQVQSPYLRFKAGTFDLAIELVRLLNSRVSEIEIGKDQIKSVLDASQRLVMSLSDCLRWFYTTTEMEIIEFNSIESVIKPAHRQSNEFASEIIDWGYLYLHFEKECLLDILQEIFKARLAINPSLEYYEDTNRQEANKIRHFLSALTIAYIAINSNKTNYEIDGLPVSDTLRKLQKWIIEYFLRFSRNNTAEERLDVLDDTYTFFIKNPYSTGLHNLLHQCLNYFDHQEREDFIREFYEDSIELGRMLSALNIIESKRTHKIIKELIDGIS